MTKSAQVPLAYFFYYQQLCVSVLSKYFVRNINVIYDSNSLSSVYLSLAFLLNAHCFWHGCPLLLDVSAVEACLVFCMDTLPFSVFSVMANILAFLPFMSPM